MNRNLVRAGLAVATAGAVAVTTVVAAQGSSDSDESRSFAANLTGFNEDPNALSTTGRGSFRAKIGSGGTISYTLSYSGTEGTVTQAHVHLGGRHQSGGISAFLCTNLGNNASTPTCPESGTVTGVIEAEDVIGPASQGISAGQMAELVRAMRARAVYANVHTTLYPAGEIRGQLR